MQLTRYYGSQLCQARRRYLPVVSIITVSIFLNACSWDSFVSSENTQTVDEAGSSDQWDTPFDRLGMMPVLPPSEDVQVGDIFVYSFNPDLQVRAADRSRRAKISISPRWDSLNLLQDLDAEYRLRPDWPAASEVDLQNRDIPRQMDSGDAGVAQSQGLFSGEHVTRRLRSFGVPELNTFILSDQQANSIVPTEAINLVFGSAWNDNKSIAIRINSAETYSLGLRKVISAALDESGPEIVLREPYRNQLSLIADPAAQRVWVRILSDIVYLRSIDIIVQSRSGFEEDDEVMAEEFSASVEKTVTVIEEDSQGETDGRDEADIADQETAVDEEMPHTKTITSVAVDHALDPAYAAFVRARAINETLIETDADDLSASQLRFVSVTDDSITVRRIWQHGLAIGARGLSLEVDAITGVVLRSGYLGTLIP